LLRTHPLYTAASLDARVAEQNTASRTIPAEHAPQPFCLHQARGASSASHGTLKSLHHMSAERLPCGEPMEMRDSVVLTQSYGVFGSCGSPVAGVFAGALCPSKRHAHPVVVAHSPRAAQMLSSSAAKSLIPRLLSAHLSRQAACAHSHPNIWGGAPRAYDGPAGSAVACSWVARVARR
jgi:hypothetical protein